MYALVSIRNRLSSREKPAQRSVPDFARSRRGRVAAQ